MLELTFITSNAAKLAHIKHLCEESAIKISKKKNYGIGYIEPRIENRDELIKQSIEDAIVRFKKTVSGENNFFFIEDTSVIIEALSEKSEFPGVDVKYWMKNNTFNSLDIILRERGNNRSAIVRSDIILVLSKDLREKLNVTYKIFTSYTKGRITEKEYEIKTKSLYPWLDDSTFNKWFIPDGCNIPMSLLDINEADEKDFRAGAVRDMVKFLAMHNLVKTKEEYRKTAFEQLNLFEQKVFIFCGPSCAGKTTLATYLMDKFKYLHLEASDFMYLSFYERHGIRSKVHIADFAEDILKENPSIVADQIINNIKGLDSISLVITGFRDPKEIKSFILQCKGNLHVEKIIYIDADQQLRYERSINRARNDNEKTFDEFVQRDEQQHQMGLSLIKKNIADTIIENNKTVQELCDNFCLQFEMQLNNFMNLPLLVMRGKDLQNTIIQTLAKQPNLEQFYTTTEIAHLINSSENSTSKQKNKNNVSRYFNQNFHPYFEIMINNDGHATYRLSQTGIAYSKFFINTN